MVVLPFPIPHRPHSHPMGPKIIAPSAPLQHPNPCVWLETSATADTFSELHRGQAIFTSRAEPIPGFPFCQYVFTYLKPQTGPLCEISRNFLKKHEKPCVFKQFFKKPGLLVLMYYSNVKDGRNLLPLVIFVISVAHCKEGLIKDYLQQLEVLQEMQLKKRLVMALLR